MKSILILLFVSISAIGSSQSVMMRDTTQAKIDSLFKLCDNQNATQQQILLTIESAGTNLRNSVIIIAAGVFIAAIGTVLAALPSKPTTTTTTINGHATTTTDTGLSGRQIAGLTISGVGGAITLGGIFQIGIAGSKMKKLNPEL